MAEKIRTTHHFVPRNLDLSLHSKLEKSIPWVTILAIFALVIFGVGIVLNEIIADVVTPSVTVGNVAPTVGAVTLNENNDITITENSTKTVTGTTTVTDNNGYNDITSVTSTLYLNNTTTCGTSDANWCYAINWVTCATNTCDGLSCVASCTADVWFIAEPTDASGTYPTKEWQMDITAVDTGSNSDTGTGTEELNTASYLDITATIAYSTLNPGATSSEQNTHATNTGNHAINVELSGDNMETGGATSSIVVGQQKYSSSSSMGDWVGTALTGAATEYDLDLSKPTATTSDSTDELYWMIKIPTSTSPGYYTGTNTVGAFYSS